MRDLFDEPRASREARAEMRADAEDAKDRAYRKRMGELAAEGAVTPISPTTARVNGPRPAATDLPGGERAPLIAMHGGHVYEGTWSDLREHPLENCAACGARINPYGTVGGPCPGWPSTGGADALLRLVRGLTAEVRDDAPRTHREAARDAFSGALDALSEDPSDSERQRATERAWQRLAQAEADEQRALRLALAASDPHAALRSFLAAIPTPLASGTKGPVEEAFEALDIEITRQADTMHGGVALHEAAEHLADVIRVRLREIQALALGWRETVRAHHELLAGLDETTTRITREAFTAGFLACREKVLVEVDRTSPRPELLRRAVADLLPPKPPPKEPAIVQGARRAVTLADIAHAVAKAPTVEQMAAAGTNELLAIAQASPPSASKHDAMLLASRFPDRTLTAVVLPRLDLPEEPGSR